MIDILRIKISQNFPLVYMQFCLWNIRTVLNQANFVSQKIFNMSRDICHYLAGGRDGGCSWHLVDRGQGCWETSYNGQFSPSPQHKITQSKMSVVARGRNFTESKQKLNMTDETQISLVPSSLLFWDWVLFSSLSRNKHYNEHGNFSVHIFNFLFCVQR